MDIQFHKRERDGIPFYTCAALEGVAGLRHGFSTRIGGVSSLPRGSLNLGNVAHDTAENIAENRRRFGVALGLGAAPWATLAQIHSDEICFIREDSAPAKALPCADAIATRQNCVAIGVQVADCFPIILADPRGGAIAAVHAGWRGTLRRIAAKTVAALAREFTADPANVVAAVGPGIRSCCFEVGAEVAEQFEIEYPGARLTRPHAAGKYLLDLGRALAIQLGEIGLRPENIFDSGACTACNAAEFFSYRRDGQHTGRMMALIARCP
jgi:polyphenol oxidase